MSDIKTVRGNPSAAEWNREDGYRTLIEVGEDYPYRVFGADMLNTMMARIGVILDDVSVHCSEFSAGFRLTLHAPDDLPKARSDFIHISPEQNTFVMVTPELVTTSESLRKYSIFERNCYFKLEHQLRFFKSYSQSKCTLECLTIYIKNKCGCVHFSMPSKLKCAKQLELKWKIKHFYWILGQKGTRICTIKDMLCYYNNKKSFDKELVVNKCECLPDCHSINYLTEIAQAPYHYFEDDDVIEMTNTINTTG